MPFITMKQWYRSELCSSDDYVATLPQRLHIDPDYVAKRFSERRNTLFREVNVVPAKDIVTPHMRVVFNAKPVRHESMADLLDGIKKRLQLVVRENWSSTFDHVVLHSSGLDSRMLSWTIRQLYEELGDEWLGNVLFLCSKREADSFKDIMAYEGWGDNQYWIPDEETDMSEYYQGCLLDFANAWRRANGCIAIPVNLFWYPILRAQFACRIGHPVQLWTGQWGNTVFDAGSGEDAGDGIRRVFKMFYWSALCSRPMKGIEVIHPYTDCGLAYLVASSKIRLGKQLRPLLLESMDKGLLEFLNIRSDGDRHVRIADWIIDEMIRDYQSSWYGQEVAPDARPKWKTTEFQPFWSRWTAASLCEYLRGNGYTISIG